MASEVKVKGYFGEESGGSLEGIVAVRFVTRGMAGTLTIEYLGRYGVTVPYKTVEQFAAIARRKAKLAGANQTTEEAVNIDGFYSDGGTRMLPGKVEMWLRSKRGFETLTVEFGRRGQISLPYAVVEDLIHRERRHYF